MPNIPQLAWLFVDMNSFFASVEQHLRPELRGEPVGVVPVMSEGTCIIAASREAKARGIKMGAGVREARASCPGLHVVLARPDVYVRVHHGVARAIDRCAPLHKAYSIDEWALRLVGKDREPTNATKLARDIKASILQDFSPSVTCSIGAAPTRLLAKIACDLEKPDGLTVLNTPDLPEKIEHLPLEDLCGIGNGMFLRLERHGIQTVRELWALTRRQSIDIWGSISGAHWWAGFHGYDEPEIRTRRSSMSHANVLEPRFRNPAGARAILTRLVCRLGIRLREAECVATALTIEVRDVHDRRGSLTTTLPHVQDSPTLVEAFYALWDQLPPLIAPPLHVGAFVSGLVPASQVTGHLFQEAENGERLSRAMDAITQRWGISSLYFGSMHDCRHHMDDKIAFGRIPSGVTLNPIPSGSGNRLSGTSLRLPKFHPA
jgi:DNA polymerase-4